MPSLRFLRSAFGTSRLPSCTRAIILHGFAQQPFDRMASGGTMAAQYTEEDLREACICGVMEGAQHGNANADETFNSTDTDWIDAHFYYGFKNQDLLHT